MTVGKFLLSILISMGLVAIGAFILNLIGTKFQLGSFFVGAGTVALGLLIIDILSHKG